MSEVTVNWKKIAEELGRRINWVISNIDARGSGCSMDLKTGEVRHWKGYMAEGLRMIPGAVIDEEILDACCLTGKERIKRLRQIEKQREEARNDHLHV